MQLKSQKFDLGSEWPQCDSSLMPCLKYNLSLIQMQLKSQKLDLGSEWLQCEVYVIFLSVSFKV